MKTFPASILLIFAFSTFAAKADRSPNLILEENSHLFSFHIPPKWFYSEKLTKKAGVPLLVVPSLETANPYRANIYVNVACSKKCGVPGDHAIGAMLDKSKRRHSKLKTNPLPSVTTESGLSAQVWLLSDLSYADISQEAIAFIDTNHAVVLAVLSVRSTSTWEADYNSFIKFVSGFKLLDCNSEDSVETC